MYIIKMIYFCDILLTNRRTDIRRRAARASVNKMKSLNAKKKRLEGLKILINEQYNEITERMNNHLQNEL